ncbi:hypothetical protein M446_4091 [Methylobacterium sp. 4-46]|uniref:hypothetical protein n=1 Tax=unclassified Methylobacterium TaxID=2615210 RepID=UPI000152DDBA|nr:MULTISPECIES: hypothetical protein [Methylobacterium]ACA18449.1 hypothetical protein M446_4091 [Methylobacterium sp. 4-46]WFT77740.1 hypothetical protein QA634_20790 [Methylobacterium nodulans]
MIAARLHPLTPAEEGPCLRRLAAAGYLLVAKAGRAGIGFVWPSPPEPPPGVPAERAVSIERVQAAEAAGVIVPCTVMMGADLLGPQPVPAWRARGRS